VIAVAWATGSKPGSAIVEESVIGNRAGSATAAARVRGTYPIEAVQAAGTSVEAAEAATALATARCRIPPVRIIAVRSVAPETA